MRRAFILLFALFGVASFMLPARPASAAPNAQVEMERIVVLVNQHRAAAGLTPVTFSPTLGACAQRYSAVIAAQGGLSHTGPDGSTPGQRLTRCGYRWKHYGENLAGGYYTANEVVTAWMNSAGHRRNIMNPKLREIGLGYTHLESDPGRYFDYFVMELGLQR